jgi:DNA-binding winged helix-turn-helix (wHTH) protein/tetratricopeptide (TPR) repeat protein/TolB-like protein
MASSFGSSIAPSTTLKDPAPRPEHSPAAPLIYLFGAFRLDPANRLLTGEGCEVPLPGRAFDLLFELVRHPGQLLVKEDLLAAVWEGSFVEESNLTVAISTLRRSLHEDPQDRRFIQTVARRGYRFIADVTTEASLPQTIRSAPARPAAVEAPESIAAELSAASPRAQVSIAHRWSLLGVYALLFALLGVCAWYLLKPHIPLRSLAVLPLTVASAKPGAPDEIQLLGLTDALATRLESQMAVRPTSSVLRYSAPPGQTIDPVAAGREQAVDAVLTGVLTTTRADSNATLQLRLVRVQDGVVLWKDTFRNSSLAALESDAGTAAARQLHHLGAAAPPAPKQPVDPLAQANNPAWQLYLRGRYFWNLRTPDGLRKSVDCFRQAIDADPNFAPAYAGLADSYALLASFSVEPGSSANADARSAALSAIHLDPTLAEPHASLGMVLFFTDWNLHAAESEFERAISLDPNYATAHHWYSLDLAAMGRFPQALYEARLAQKLDPLSFIINTNVGWIEYLAHDNIAADHDLDRVLELDPTFARARTRLGMVELSTGKPNVAVQDFNQALAGSTDPDPYVLGLLGDAQAKSGDRAAAERTLDKLHQIGLKTYVPPISRALVLIGLGRNQEAITALAQAIDDHSTSLVYARVDPTLDPLRDDPAFQALLARSKL